MKKILRSPIAKGQAANVRCGQQKRPEATFYYKMQKLIPLIAAALTMAFIASFARAMPSRVVLGYSATWRDPDSPPEFYNYDAVTYIARSFLVPHPDGTVEVPTGYFNKSLKEMAHTHGVKLLMSLGGEASNADNWLSIARHPEHFARFCDQLDQLLKDQGYDGIDIDWEPSATTAEDAAAFTSFMKALRARFPHQTITTALGASEYWIGHFNWKDITDNVDFVNVMTYDYSGAWGGRAGYTSGLFPAGAYTPDPDLSASEGMKNLIKNHHVPPEKLLMGITFWAVRFGVDHIGDHFPVNAPGYTYDITYAETMSLLSGGAYKNFWDDKAAMPYLQRTAGGSVIVYENPKSILHKCEYAGKIGCPGIMIWHLGSDVQGDRAPLMDEVAKFNGVHGNKFPRSAIEQQLAELQSDIGQLKHSSKPDNGLGSSELPPVAGASSLSADQLEKLFRQMESDWASLQDQVWQQEAMHREKP
jgi:chitinase